MTLSYAETRYKWGDLQMSEPSRFLDEIDPKYVDRPSRRNSYNTFARESQKNTLQPGSTLFTKPQSTTTPGKNFKKLSSYRDASGQSTSRPAPGKGGEDYENIVPGIIVEHVKFGKGIVKIVEGTGANKKAVVDFKIVGPKQLLLRFARLMVVE